MITASTGKSVSKYQLRNKRSTFQYRIHWNINVQKSKFLYEQINGRVGWNKHSGEQH